MNQLKFYATNQNYTNRLFTFYVKNYEDGARVLSTFRQKCNVIKSAYFCIMLNKKQIINQKLNMNWFGITGCLIPWLHKSNWKVQP